MDFTNFGLHPIRPIRSHGRDHTRERVLPATNRDRPSIRRPTLKLTVDEPEPHDLAPTTQIYHPKRYADVLICTATTGSDGARASSPNPRTHTAAPSDPRHRRRVSRARFPAPNSNPKAHAQSGDEGEHARHGLTGCDAAWRSDRGKKRSAAALESMARNYSRTAGPCARLGPCTRYTLLLGRLEPHYRAWGAAMVVIDGIRRWRSSRATRPWLGWSADVEG